MPRAFSASALLLLFLTTTLSGASTEARQPLPSLVLWAWERPEDLRFLDPKHHAVAVLVGTVDLVADDLRLRGRRQPLSVPTGTRLLAVVRLESDRNQPPTLSREQQTRTASTLLAWSERADAEGLQIDFDAKLSERDFYRGLLAHLRRRLPAHLSLHITALASWCLGDPWLRDLPVDSAVPMLFRMGSEGPTIRRAIDQGADFSAEPCRSSVGIATDEPVPLLPLNRRIFVFHPRPWTPEAWSSLTRHLEELHR